MNGGDFLILFVLFTVAVGAYGFDLPAWFWAAIVIVFLFLYFSWAWYARKNKIKLDDET